MKLKHLLCLLTMPALFFTSSCATDPGYSEVSYGGNLYYYDMYGTYYRHYWHGYRPCPKPPGKPDRPIERPPGHKPENFIELPVNNRSSFQPMTQPNAPSSMPSFRPMPSMLEGGGERMHGGGGERIHR